MEIVSEIMTTIRKSIEKRSDKNSKEKEEQENYDNFGKIVVRQGERLTTLEKQNEKLKEKLIQERMEHIDDLKNIKYIAQSNPYSNEKALLRKIVETANDLIQNKKELSSHTDQSIN